MKRSLILFILLLAMFSGCATWKGMKKDSSDAWDATKEGTSKAYESTKEAIHEATE
ncbi:MAG: entericidin EcnAB [Halarcobacter sp.]